ncbi:hypothetical protein EHQ61_09795 [Leptospira wolffii]|uniref:hypothetical protein n=1 Tax=Leptospira wolffii TaxID=409998 RepID=UPI0010837FCE|nr:hypothetical protein [Leptospira wolffii]TGL50689.1 hypothetical protein EHQ61_09795 [Leptospira wolffii]
MKKIGILLLFVLLVGVPRLYSKNDPTDPNLSNEERDDIIRNQENKWDFKPAHESSSVSKDALPKIHSSIRSTGETAYLTLGPLEVYIPSGAFDGFGEVKIETIALTKHSDFIFAGIPMEIQGKEPIILESVGMFRIAFLDSNGRSLRPQKEISVGMNPLDTTDNARVYKLTGDVWKETSKLQKSQRNDCEIECAGYIIYSSIQSEGWWNFDKPHKEFTCLKGTVDAPAGSGISISSAGVDYYGMSYAHVRSDGSFEINVLKNRKVKVFTTNLNPGSKSKFSKGYLGYLPTLQTQDKVAFATNDPKKCQDIGKIQVRSVSSSLMEDRTAFLKAIDMPDR